METIRNVWNIWTHLPFFGTWIGGFIMLAPAFAVIRWMEHMKKRVTATTAEKFVAVTLALATLAALGISCFTIMMDLAPRDINARWKDELASAHAMMDFYNGDRSKIRKISHASRTKGMCQKAFDADPTTILYCTDKLKDCGRAENALAKGGPCDYSPYGCGFEFRRWYTNTCKENALPR